MKSLIPWKNKKLEPVTRGQQLVPFGEFSFSLGRMRDEFDRFFERLARDFSDIAEISGEGWRWGLDIDDEDTKVIVRAEAPGFEAGDFDVRVEDSQLVLRAAKKTETKDEKSGLKEFREQECFETVALPAGIDKENVDATYHNGVLTVTLPKTKESRAKRIAIKAS